MIPTREDLIRALTDKPLHLSVIAQRFGCTTVDAQKVLKSHDDFAPCAPQPGEGPCFSYRLCPLACDPRTRALAARQCAERPPQLRKFHDDSAHKNDSLLVAWLRENAGEWAIADVARLRGVSIQAIRKQVRIYHDQINQRRSDGIGRPLFISFKV